MSRSFDALVIGAQLDGLVAATHLAKKGRKVLLVEAADEPGGALREIEFAPGFRGAPLAPRFASPTIVCGEGRAFLLHSSVEPTSESLRAHSVKDAAGWPQFVARTRASAGFLAQLYRSPPPRIDASTFGEFLSLANLARKYRRLGRAGMIDLLRTLPMPIADLAADEFETPVLQGALSARGVWDVAQGPAAAGTAFAYLHSVAATLPGVNHEALALGPQAAITRATDQARAAGVTMQMQTRVAGLTVREGRVTGANLQSAGEGASEEEVTCRAVISSLDPWTSLLELLDPKHLDPEFIHAVRNVRYRGVATKILLAMDALPASQLLLRSGGSADAAAAIGPGASVLIAPSTRYVERAYEATKYGRCSEDPIVEVQFPSVQRPELAPPGKHVAVVHVQYTPYRLRADDWDAQRDVVADRALAQIERQLPGFAACIRERRVLAPPDLQAVFAVREGAVSQGELMLDQILFMRPVPEASRYATPIAGYFICGAGTHPGPGIHGISGRLAARAALQAL